MQINDFEKNAWNTIVERYYQNKSASEAKIENEWDAYLFELFGYSRLAGEIEHQPSISIGSGQRIVPDIIIKNKDGYLFDLELKKYDLPFTVGMQGQLISYLNQLHLSIGVLICQSIYIYSYTYNTKEIKKIEIPFEKDNPLGFDFVHLFRRQNFSKEKISEYINESQKIAIEIEKLKNEITEDYVYEILKDYFSDSYSKQTINTVFEELEIELSFKNEIDDDDGGNGGDQRCGKKEAISLFYRKGYALRPTTTTYAAKNNGDEIYWANPPKHLVEKNWSIILDDHINKTLRLFIIPANTFSETAFEIRKDKTNYINLHIQYNDSTFTDRRSGISFARFLKESIGY